MQGLKLDLWQRALHRESIDYHEVFSPVVKHSSIHILLAIVAYFDLELEQLDVQTTFLNGDLEEKIYMKQPEGFEYQVLSLQNEEELEHMSRVPYASAVGSLMYAMVCTRPDI
ncbi:hypothetical protein M0R45_015986 [Rubus argutus]|uniref:Reverse transcriptase Ty1/copia-type domain-containing protein n=1 Tax=Rubus argutus TaxID=59490 RepID=A0AAW1XQU0_RUBAR